ncbi:YhjD/YihY/BrkB family envelope integrity protein [Microbacterium sp.]|uniref:YhjD/YihY/BrkB family envelope integrity protein n=1 Tax=Microbacterium sp. TaxID=51671 RepID=UPI0039E5269C
MPPRTPISRVIAWVLTLRPVRAFLRYSELRGPMLADSVTYRALFGVFAGVLLGFSVAALWLSGNAEAWRALVAAVDAAIPGLVGEDGIISPSSIRAPAGLSVATVVSLVSLAGAAIGAIGSLRIALRTIAGAVADDVPWLRVLVRNLALGVGIGMAFLVAATATLAGTAGVGWVVDALGLEGERALATWSSRAVAVLVTFLLDAGAIALLFRVLSGVRASGWVLWGGALLGGAGLTVLQQLSGLFVGGASANPLLAAFASLIALLLWVNLSTQVILIASAYIVTSVEEQNDRVRARHGAQTFAQRRVRRAEDAVAAASEELRRAREARAKERERE